MSHQIAGALDVRVEVADPSGDPGGRWDEAKWDDGDNWSAIEPYWTDITAYTYSVPSLTRGRDWVEERMRTGEAVVLLDNDSALFNPIESTTPTPIRPGRWARVSTNVTYTDPVETFAGGESWPDRTAGGTIIAVGSGVELHAGGGNLGWRPQITGTIDTIGETYEGGAGKAITEVQILDFLAAFNQIDPPAREVAEWAGDTADERVTRILDDIPWFFTRDLAAGTFEFQATTLPASYLEEMQKAAASEGGVLYMDGSGSVVLRNQEWPEAAVSTDVQYRAGYVGSSIGLIASAPSWSLRRIFNDVAFTAEGGATQRRRDSASRSLFGFQSYSQTGLLNDDDDDVGILADVFLARFAEDRFRFEAIEVWPTSPAALERLLWSDLLYRIETTQPTLNLGWSYTREVYINRYTLQISEDDIAIILRVDDAFDDTELYP